MPWSRIMDSWTGTSARPFTSWSCLFDEAGTRWRRRTTTRSSKCWSPSRGAISDMTILRLGSEVAWFAGGREEARAGRHRVGVRVASAA